MSTTFTFTFWTSLIALLAVEVTVIISVATAMQRLTRSAAWRRTIWQACLLGLGALLIFEFTGIARGMAAWANMKLRASRESSARQRLLVNPVIRHEASPLSENFQHQAEARPFYNQSGNPAPASKTQAAAVPPNHSMQTPSVPLNPSLLAIKEQPLPSEHRALPMTEPLQHWWIGAIWLLGTAAISARAGLWRLLFLVGRWRSQSGVEPRIQQRVQELGPRVGLYRCVRIIELARLSGPIAFGVWRPTIGVPSRFTEIFDPLQQDAMLVHELAHLAARDPLWRLVAELMAAALWWHPFAWWARHQLRATSESAADEASLLIVNGPGVLAECLVELGTRLTQPLVFGGMGIEGNGFRSGLGRRVERLINLNGQTWSPPSRLRSGLAQVLVPAALLLAAILCTAGTLPNAASGRGETPMKALQENWKRSLAAFALAAAITTDADAAATKSAEQKATPPQSNTAAPAESESIHWQRWSPEAVAEARDEGRPVLVHFTADWCVTAGVNKKTSLETSAVRKKLKEMNAVAFEADYTQQNQAIDAELKKFGRGGVPLDVVYPADQKAEPLVLPEVLTKDLVLAALDKAAPDAAIADAPARAPSPDPAPAQSKGQQIIRARLEQIRLPETPAFDGVPLNEVVKYLANEARNRDPKQRGVNFIINPHVDDSSQSSIIFDPDTGEPVPLPSVAPPDLWRLLIKLPTMRDIRLIDMLDVITKSPAHPIKYSIEDYAVVFSHKVPESPQFFTRVFKVNPNTARKAIEDVEAVLFRRAPATQIPDSNSKLPENLLDMMRIFFLAGVNFFPPSTNSLFYNDREGLLMVRASLQNLEIVEQVLERFNSSPPQVNIETKFCEVTEDDIKALGLHDVLNELRSLDTNGLPQVLLTNQNVRLSLPAPGVITALLTEPQMRQLQNALDQRAGVDLLAGPRVITLSGRQAQISVQQMKNIVTGVQAKTNDTGRTEGKSDSYEINYQTTAVPVGPMVDVLPQVAADGFTIALKVTGTLTEFLGYDEPTEAEKLSSPSAGNVKSQPPLPRFRVRQLASNVTVRDGQTVLLAAPFSEETVMMKSKVPLLGDLPLMGRFFRHESKSKVKKRLLLFLTPTLVDPAGNPLHTPDNLPFDPNATPPQAPTTSPVKKRVEGLIETTPRANALAPPTTVNSYHVDGQVRPPSIKSTLFDAPPVSLSSDVIANMARVLRDMQQGSQTTPSRTTLISNLGDFVPTHFGKNIEDAEMLIEQGKFGEAETKLKQALQGSSLKRIGDL